MIKLSHHPLIYRFSYWSDRADALLFLYPLSYRYRQDPLYYLCSFGWHVGKIIEKSLQKSYRRFRRLFYNHHIIFLCNTIAETEFLLESDYNAIFCNNNCFVDEKTYRPLGMMKTLDAVYDARISAFKRHELCKELDSIGLISYVHDFSHDAAYVTHIISSLAHAHWFNKRNGIDIYLDDGSVNEAINRCRVGLCLSAAEGAMYGSIQYLLAGLPVVTTPNVGGRDVFFRPEYVHWVKPDPHEIKCAVYDLIEKKLNPDYIRKRTLKIIWEHRTRFFNLVDQICDWHGTEHFIRDDWKHMFVNRLLIQNVTANQADKIYHRLAE